MAFTSMIGLRSGITLSTAVLNCRQQENKHDGQAVCFVQKPPFGIL